MTDLAALPLLLLRSQVCAVLGWQPNIVRSYRNDGDLRVFRPNPGSAFAYYFKSDVARIAGRPLDLGWIEALPEWLTTGQFRQHSGLSEQAIYKACECDQLVAIRQRFPHHTTHRRFYAKDLKWFT